MKTQIKFVILGLIFATAAPSFAAIVKSTDKAQGCTLYRVTNQETPAKSDESEVIPNEVYGLSIRDLEIDFTKKQVTVDVLMHIVAGFDRNLTPHRLTISSTNPQLKYLTNEINRTIYLFNGVCINHQNEIVYAVAP